MLTAVLFNNDLVVSIDTKPADTALVPVFLSFALIFFAPLLTMRLFAEESREGTFELLLTAPVSRRRNRRRQVSGRVVFLSSCCWR